MKISIVNFYETQINYLSSRLSDGEYVLVLCDCTLHNLAVYFPDATIKSNLIIKCVKTDSTAHTAVLYPNISGQKLKYLDSLTLVNQGDNYELVSDRSNNWI